MITSKAPICQRIRKHLRFKRTEKRREALRKLEEAIGMKRQDGRIDAIREAFDDYMTALYPYRRKKLRRAA